MNGFRMPMHALLLVLAALLIISCGEKGTKEETKSVADEETAQQEGSVSYVSGEVSFGVFFDEKGTQRTLKLDKDRNEFDVYLIINAPEEMEIAAAEWRLVLPEGVSIVNDRYYLKRTIAMGPMEYGLSESFPCVTGPSFVFHVLTLRTDRQLTNAEIAVMPSIDGEFLGIAECREGFPRIRATSYRAVVNPEE